MTDPALRGALLLEVAEQHLNRGGLAEAEQALVEASGLGHGRYAALERLYYHALLTGDRGRAIAVLEQQAELAGAFARGEDDTVEDDNAPLGRFVAPEAAAIECAVLYREMAQLKRQSTADPLGELSALEAALECHQDPLLWHEFALACQRAGVHGGAARAAHRMSACAGDPKERAAWLFRTAKAESAQGHAEKALALVRTAAETDPVGPAFLHALAGQLWVNGEHAALCAHLRARADREPEDRDRLLLQAAHVALRLLGDEALADTLCQLIDPIDAEAPLSAQRLLMAEAVTRGWEASEARATDRLIADSPDERERAHLLRARYLRLLDGSPERPARFEAARDYLLEVLPMAACADWAPHAARVKGAQHRDFRLLALAHEALAEARAEPGPRSAHHCAAARACIRAGDVGRAEQQLRSALALLPRNSYAVALLQQVLVRQGYDNDAMELLRDNAQLQDDHQKALCALLDAGLAAELNGSTAAAAARYREALALGEHSPPAGWALLSLAERSKDEDLLHEALSHLAQHGAWPIASLLLAESCDAQGRFADADKHARRALSYPQVSYAAALRLWTYGHDDSARSAGLSHLRTANATSPFVPLSHSATESEAGPANTASDPDRAAFQDALGALLALLDPRRAGAPASHAGAYFTLAQLCDSARTHAELTLQALRCDLLRGQRQVAEAAVVKALSLRVSAPDAVETAIALDELVGPAEDPKLRLLALSGRLRPYGTAAPFSVRLAQAQERLACGHVEGALSEARTLVQERDDDLASLELLREAAYLAGAPADLAHADEALARACTPRTAAALLLEAAACYAERLGQPEDARRCLQACLTQDPTHEEAFGRLHDLLLDQADVEGVLALLESRISRTMPAEYKVDLLYEAACLYRARGEPAQALQHLSALLELDPRHIGGLGLQAEAYSALGDHRAAVNTLYALAATGIPAGQRRLVRLGAADLLAIKLGDTAAAIGQLRLLETEGLADLEVYGKLAELYQGAGLHREAVSAFRRAASRDRGTSQGRWLRRAAELLEHTLADPQQALAAYNEALVAAPTDRVSHEALQRLLTDEVERVQAAARFLGQVQVRLAAQPLDPDLLRGLRSAGAHGRRSFAEYAALDTLRALQLTTPEEQDGRRRLIQRGVHRRLRALSDEELRGLRKERDGGIGHELAQICSAALSRLAQLRPEAYGVHRRDRVRRGPLVNAIAAELSLFGLALRGLYVGGSDPHGAQLVPTGTRGLTDWVVGHAALQHGLTDPQRFALGRAAMAHRLQTFALFELSPGTRRDALVATACAAELSLAPLDPPPAIEQLAEKIQRHLSRKARRRLEELAVPLAQLWPRLSTYVRAAEISLLRAGLMQCGKLSVALREALAGRDSRKDPPYGPVRAREATDRTTSIGLLTPAGRMDAAPAAAIALSDAGLDLARFWTSSRALLLHDGDRTELAQREGPA